jgi:luciferase family oxidoreductase group 1
VAEHHATAGVAGGAASVVLAHVGHCTSTIRIGSGGIMLPNHNPFVIAEQFGTLDGLFPGRVDLGLGRAPGAAGIVAQALRKNLHQAAEYFPQDVIELRALLTGDLELPIVATPGLGAKVELWMLGSSLFGAQLAARLGMPYAFASHFAPDHLDAALAAYRSQFRPSPYLDRPYAMAAMTVIAADSDEEAELLASSQDQAFVRLRSGDPGQLPPPVPGYRDTLPLSARAMLEHLGQARAVGSPATVSERITRFVERTGADELIVSGATYDPAARRRSLELTMEAVS